MRPFPLRLVFALLALLFAIPAFAQQPATSREARDAERQAAFEEADKVKISGPASVALKDQAVLRLPEGLVYVGLPQAARIMRSLGNVVGDAFVGLVFDPDSDWIADVTFVKEGYVKDEEAKDWDADGLLKTLREGTEEANKDREARGFTPIEVRGWVEKPRYDTDSHRLVWSALVARKDAPAGADNGVNYNTYMLGRDGYVSLDLLTTESRIEARKPIAQALLASLSFNPGKRYEDYNASTDKVAAYGIAALVGGLAVKKLGLLALGAAFFAKFAKLALLAVFGFGAALKKFFFRGKAAPQSAEAATPEAPDATGPQA